MAVSPVAKLRDKRAERWGGSALSIPNAWLTVSCVIRRERQTGSHCWHIRVSSQ